MKLFTNMQVWSALASAVLFFGALSANDAAAQAQPIAAGQGWLAESGAAQGASGLREFSFNVVELSDGTVQGKAHVVQVGGYQFFFDVTSYDFDDAGNLIIAGPVTKIFDPGSDDPAPPILGATAVMAVQDNHGSGPDAITLIQPLPSVSPFGTPLTTLTEWYDFLVLASGGALPYGPQALYLTGILFPYTPIDAGNIVIF